MLDQLCTIVQEYTYGKRHLASEQLDIKINAVEKQEDCYAIISPFIEYGPHILAGNCSELTESLRMRLQKEMPHLTTVSVRGGEPTHFRLNGSHWYVLASNDENLKNIGKTNEESYLEAVKPIVIDPSFQQVAPFAGSQYTIQDIEDNILKPGKKKIKLNHGYSVPIGVTPRNSVVSLLADFFTDISDDALLIQERSPKKMPKLYTLNDANLEKGIPDDPGMLALIAQLRKAHPLI